MTCSSSLAHSLPIAATKGKDRAAIPRGHVQIHVREEISSLPTAVEAPALLRKAKYYRHQRSSPESLAEGNDAENPL